MKKHILILSYLSAILSGCGDVGFTGTPQALNIDFGSDGAVIAEELSSDDLDSDDVNDDARPGEGDDDSDSNDTDHPSSKGPGKSKDSRPEDPSHPGCKVAPEPIVVSDEDLKRCEALGVSFTEFKVLGNNRHSRIKINAGDAVMVLIEGDKAHAHIDINVPLKALCVIAVGKKTHAHVRNRSEIGSVLYVARGEKAKGHFINHRPHKTADKFMARLFGEKIHLDIRGNSPCPSGPDLTAEGEKIVVHCNTRTP